MNLPFTDLNAGFINAENYRRQQNKVLLTKYFVRDEFLERLLDPNIFFLVGEKGTGKTAYATFLTNSDFKNHKASSFDVRQTEYQKFLELKKGGHLVLSNYAEVWRTLLLMTAAVGILNKSGTPEFLKRFTKLRALKEAVDEFYKNAFAPEIVKMLSFIESAQLASSLIAKHMGLSAKIEETDRTEIKDSNTIFQTNLLGIRKALEEALKALKLEDHALIFIDGIDVRPPDIAYSDYFDCVRGLAEAIWAVNNDFLSNIKDSKGRIRIVLLVRPDIFLRTELHNTNTKLRDNSVFLNWATTYKDYRGSLLFKVADHLLAAQQHGQTSKLGSTWDYYFPFNARNVGVSNSEDGAINSFIAFMRFSYYRPRDINSMIGTMREILKKKHGTVAYATEHDFNDPSFRDAHADYLLGEIRDQLLFYYSQDEFDLFLQFFSHLRGKRRFTYDEFAASFNEFIAECARASSGLPQFFESANIFLQFLFEQNVICFKERSDDENAGDEPFIRWCFRERTLSNMAPKVRVGVEYEIFYGLSKALNVGRPIKVSNRNFSRVIGTIATVNAGEGFGFIRGGMQQVDYYFKIAEFKDGRRHLLRPGTKVSFVPEVKYTKLRATDIEVER